MSALWSAVNPNCPQMKVSVKTTDSGRRPVERTDPPAERQRDELVAAVSDARAQAAPFRTEDHDHLPAVVRLVVRHGLGGARAVHPRPVALRLSEVVGEVPGARDPEVLDRA